MRLFVAIEVPEDIRERIIGYYKLFSSYFDGNFVDKEKLHITVAFIGEKVKDIDFIKENIKGYSGDVLLKGIDFFYHYNHARIAYIKANDELIPIFEDIQKKLGIIEDNIVPHLTVCRIKNVKRNLEELKNKFDFSASFHFDELTLFNSDFQHYYKL